MFGLQYGVDLDQFIKQIDPIKQFQIIKELCTTGVVGPQDNMFGESFNSRQHWKALIAAAHMSKTLPSTIDSTLTVDEMADVMMSSKQLAHLTCNRLVYFSNKPNDLPIMIDTGGSLSVTPNLDDFVGRISPPDTNDLQGLSALSIVGGVGTV